MNDRVDIIYEFGSVGGFDVGPFSCEWNQQAGADANLGLYIQGTQSDSIWREKPMAFLLTKYLVTAAIVVLVSEVAKRSDKLGAFFAAMPTVTVLVLIWLFIEKQPDDKIANHAWYTFWYVIPTLPMFLLFPQLMPRIGFWPSLATSVVMTASLFWLLAVVLRRLGVNLL